MARKNFRVSSVDELLNVKKKANSKEKRVNNSLRGLNSPKTKKVENKDMQPRKKTKSEILKEVLGIEPSEDESQMNIIDWACLQRLGKRKVVDYLHHSPNGGNRHVLEGVKFKKMGTKAGFPDLFLFYPKNSFHGLFIELKKSNGKILVSQQEMHPILREQGYRVEVCYSFEAAINVIKNYLELDSSRQPLNTVLDCTNDHLLK